MYNIFAQRPYFCNYWLTYKCNSKCEFCRIWQDDSLKSITDAKFSDAKKNLDDLKKIGVKVVDFTGGEPLLNKELPKILSYAKDLGFFVKLSTNGYLYSEKADEIKNLPSRIYFSFDTTSSEEYKKIRGIDGYERLIKSIKTAKELNQEICLLYTVTDETIKNISNVVNFCKKNKVIVYIHPCFSYFGNKRMNEKYINTIKKYFWYPYVRMNLSDLDFHFKGGNNIYKPRCKVGISTIDISPDNCLTIPCFHRSIKKIKINGRLLAIYNSKEWNDLFINAGKYEFCKNCTIDCYFGLSYFDKLGRYFIKQNLSFLKNMIESMRS
jgi:MoaA/NifB/PqqE/SkfB family radical SAM enzyme